jgi:hypothetical protein
MTDEPKPEPPRADHAGARPAHNARGEERPRFLLEFPHDPELEALIEAFELGNYARVRERAPALVKDAADPAVQRAAAELLRRIEPDPAVKALLAVACALFLFVVVWVYLTQGR